jgi:hypothetical protein
MVSMSTEEEDKYRLRFVELFLGNSVESYRPAEKYKWPDGIINGKDGRKIALEITALIHKGDKVHQEIKMLDEKKLFLSNYLQQKIKILLPKSGGQIDFDINLKKLGAHTNGQCKRLGDVILDQIIPYLHKISFSDGIMKDNLEFSAPEFEMSLYLKKDMKELICTVGYEGRLLEKLDPEYVQNIIRIKENNYERKSKEYSESWLLLMESESSLRSSIDTDSWYTTCYNRIFIMQFSEKIIELKLLK